MLLAVSTNIQLRIVLVRKEIGAWVLACFQAHFLVCAYNLCNKHQQNDIEGHSVFTGSPPMTSWSPLSCIEIRTCSHCLHASWNFQIIVQMILKKLANFHELFIFWDNKYIAAAYHFPSGLIMNSLISIFNYSSLRTQPYQSQVCCWVIDLRPLRCAKVVCEFASSGRGKVDAMQSLGWIVRKPRNCVNSHKKPRWQ